jgi:hypothetical protein
VSGLGIVVLLVATLCVVGAIAAYGANRRLDAGALGVAVVLLAAMGITLLTHAGGRTHVLTGAAPDASPEAGALLEEEPGDTSSPEPRRSGSPSASARPGGSAVPSDRTSAQPAASASVLGPYLPRTTQGASPAARPPSSPATSPAASPKSSPKPSPKPSPRPSPKPSPTASPTPSPTPPPPPPPSRGDFTANATANPTCDSGGHAHPGAFQLSNTTSSNIAWQASAVERVGKSAWASVGPNKGTTNAGKTTNVSVKPVDALCKKGRGSSSDHVEISYSGGTLTVWFTVTPVA